MNRYTNVIMLFFVFIANIAYGELYFNINIKNTNCEITEVGINKEEYSYLLKDFTPLFDTEEQDCGYYDGDIPNTRGLQVKDCDKSGFHFRKLATSSVNTAIYSIFSLGTSAINSTTRKHSYFDKDEYNKCKAYILSKDNFSYDKINSIFVKHDSLSKLSKDNADKLYNKYSSIYDTNISYFKINPIIVDKTGLYKNNIDINKLIWISKNELPLFHGYLPRNLPKHLNKISFIDKTYIPNIDDINNALKSYENDLIKTTSEYKINHRINKTYTGKFNISIDCPNIVNANDKIMRPTVTIRTIDFDVLFPSYKNSDKNISIDFNGEELLISNNTNEYINVNSISTYHNDIVFTKDLNINLPPMSRSLNPIKISNIVSDKILDNANYDKIDIKKMKNTSLRFGFAVKYITSDKNKEATLYKTHKYNVYNMLIQSL